MSQSINCPKCRVSTQPLEITLYDAVIECPVCLEQTRGNDSTLLGCGHPLCKGCFVEIQRLAVTQRLPTVGQQSQVVQRPTTVQQPTSSQHPAAAQQPTSVQHCRWGTDARRRTRPFIRPHGCESAPDPRSKCFWGCGRPALSWVRIDGHYTDLVKCCEEPFVLNHISIDNLLLSASSP
jgi:hypothetical protein